MNHHRSNPIFIRTGLCLYYATIAVGFILLLSPLVLVGWLSVFSDQIPRVPPSGYTMSWYATALSNSDFINGLGMSFRIALIATAIGLIVTVPTAIALHRRQVPFARVLTQFLLSPMVIPGIVIGAGLYLILIQAEIATGLPLVGSTHALVAGHILITIPWCLRLILANIVLIDASVEDAAASLGALPLTVLMKVTVPLMWPGIVAAALFSFVVSFGNLELSVFLVAPGQTTLPIAILQYLEWRIDPSVAAISVVQMVLIIAALLVTDRFVPLAKVL